jgi:hypothetical protein
MGPIDETRDYYERSRLIHENAGSTSGLAAGFGGGALIPGFAQKLTQANGSKGILSKLIQEAEQELAGLEQVLGALTDTLSPIMRSEPPQNASGLTAAPYPVGSQVAASVMTLTARIRGIKERVLSAAQCVEV